MEGLRKIIDLTRKCSVLLLMLHFYVYCYKAFENWHLTRPTTQQLIEYIGPTGLFSHFYITKLGSLLCLVVSLLGTKGKKDEQLTHGKIWIYLTVGLFFYGGSAWMFYIPAASSTLDAVYMLATSLGFILILHGGVLLTRLLKNKQAGDIFNRLQETFPPRRAVTRK